MNFFTTSLGIFSYQVIATLEELCYLKVVLLLLKELENGQVL